MIGNDASPSDAGVVLNHAKAPKEPNLEGLTDAQLRKALRHNAPKR